MWGISDLFWPVICGLVGVVAGWLSCLYALLQMHRRGRILLRSNKPGEPLWFAPGITATDRELSLSELKKWHNAITPTEDQVVR